MRRHYVTTFVAEVVVVVGYLLTFRIVAQHLGTTGFGEYALSRRALALLVPLSLLGVDMAMARNLALMQSNRVALEARLPAAALVTMGGCVGALSVTLFAFREPLAQAFFGSTKYSSLLLTFPILLIGNGLHSVAYGFLRGTLRIPIANVLAAVNQGIIPIVVVVFVPGSVAVLLALIGTGWAIVAAPVLLSTHMTLIDLRNTITELIGYGARRIPGDLLQLGIFALPSVVVAQSAGIVDAGIVAFGIAAIGMVGSALTPIQFVLLPVAARYLAIGSMGELRRHLGLITRLIVLGLIAVTILLEGGADLIARVYLGPAFESGGQVLRVVALSVLPWGLVVTLRSVIDARHYRAINARNMAAAFVTFSLVTLVGKWLIDEPAWSAIVAFDAAIYVVSILTIVEVVKILRRPSAIVPAELKDEATRAEVLSPETSANLS